MENKKPLVCILVLNWNGLEMMDECLKFLNTTTYNNYKIIVIDNGSEDKERVLKLKTEYPEIDLLLLEKNFGYPVGMNAGYKFAEKKYNPDYFVEFNNDVYIIQPEWLDIQIDELEKRPDCGLSSGKLLFLDGRVQALTPNSEKGIFEQDSEKFNFIAEVPYVRGASLIVKRQVTNKIGFQDENLFFAPNDIDLCYRAKEAGFKTLYNGFSKMIHLCGRSSALNLPFNPSDQQFLVQTEGMLVFNMRYSGLFKGGLVMSPRFLFRALVTRKDPYKQKTLKNLRFHKTFIKRIFYFFKAFYIALTKYDNIRSDTMVKMEEVKL